MTAVWESFVAFNSAAPKLEWRIETNGDRAVPYAIIHRRSISDAEAENKPTDVLIVAKVAQPETYEGCTVGLVLATGNPNANDQARKLADEKARTFACGKDERVVIGNAPDFGRVDNCVEVRKSVAIGHPSAILPPPSGLPDISPARGEIAAVRAFANLQRRRKTGPRRSCRSPPCGGDVRQGRGGRCPAGVSQFR